MTGEMIFWKILKKEENLHMRHSGKPSKYGFENFMKIPGKLAKDRVQEYYKILNVQSSMNPENC